MLETPSAPPGLDVLAFGSCASPESPCTSAIAGLLVQLLMVSNLVSSADASVPLCCAQVRIGVLVSVLRTSQKCSKDVLVGQCFVALRSFTEPCPLHATECVRV